jgi:hypothetical protein
MDKKIVETKINRYKDELFLWRGELRRENILRREVGQLVGGRKC